MTTIRISQRDGDMPVVEFDDRALPGVASIWHGMDGQRVEITLSVRAKVLVNAPGVAPRIAIRTIGQIGAALADVEAALPEGWRLRVSRTDEDFDVWEASAVSPAFFDGENDSDAEYVHGEGPTFVAAMRALDAALRALR